MSVYEKLKHHADGKTFITTDMISRAEYDQNLEDYLWRQKENEYYSNMMSKYYELQKIQLERYWRRTVNKNKPWE